MSKLRGRHENKKSEASLSTHRAREFDSMVRALWLSRTHVRSWCWSFLSFLCYIPFFHLRLYCIDYLVSPSFPLRSRISSQDDYGRYG